MKLGSILDMCKNQIINMVFQNLATAPSNPKEGMPYWDTTDKVLKIYNGEIFNSLGAGSGTVTSVGLSNDGHGDMTISNSPVTGAGTITITHSNADITPQGTQGLRPIAFDKKGHVTGYGDVVVPLTASDKGIANGICPLGADSKIASTYLPSYVDDMVDLLAVSNTAPATFTTGDKYFNTTSKLIFTATSSSAWDSGVAPIAGIIYLNLGSSDPDSLDQYRFGGDTLTLINDSKIHKFVYTINGDSSATSFAVTHSLGTRDVIVQIFDSASYEEILTDVTRTSTEVVTVSFATAPATGTNYRVVIIA